MEKGEAPEHLEYIDYIILWCNAADIFEKGEKITQIILEASFATKQSKVKGPARETQISGIKWQHWHYQIAMDVVNKTAATFLPMSRKEAEAFLGSVGFWKMHIPEHSQIISSLYYMTQKKNDFKCNHEQQKAFEQMKQKIACALALGKSGQDKMWKMCSMLQMGRLFLPRVSGKKTQYPGRLTNDS